MLDKAPAILAALTRLSSRVGSDAFVLADHWESDRCAIGVASPRDARVLVYISCHGELPDRFGYELELPPPLDSDLPYQVVGAGSGLSCEELVDVVAEHLQRAKIG